MHKFAQPQPCLDQDRPLHKSRQRYKRYAIPHIRLASAVVAPQWPCLSLTRSTCPRLCLSYTTIILIICLRQTSFVCQFGPYTTSHIPLNVYEYLITIPTFKRWPQQP